MLKWTRFLPWWVPVLALVLAVVWGQRVRITEQAVIRILESRGIAVRVLELETAELSGATISGALLDFGRFSLTLQGVEARYTLEKLFRGDVDSLTISSASVRIKPVHAGDEPDDRPISLDAMAKLLVPVLDTRLPVETLEVDRLEFEGSSPALPPGGRLLITSFGREMQLQSSIRSARLTVRKSGAGINATVTDEQGTETARIALSFSRDADGSMTGISGMLSSDTSLLAPLFLEDIQADWFGVSGQATLDLVATSDDNAGWNLSVAGTLPDVTYRNMSMDGLTVEIRLGISVTGLTPSFSFDAEGLSGIRASRLVAGDMSMTQLHWLPAGMLTWNGSDVHVSFVRPAALSFSGLTGKHLEMGKTRIHPAGSAVIRRDTLELVLDQPAPAGSALLRIGDTTVRDLNGTLFGQLEFRNGRTGGQLSAPTRLEFTQILMSGIRIGPGHASPVLSFTASGKSTTVELHPATSFHADSMQSADTKVLNVNLNLVDGTRIRPGSAGTASPWSLSGGSWEMAPAELETGNLHMRARQMTLDLARASVDSSELRLDLQDVVLETPERTHHLEKAVLDASINAGEVEAKGSFVIRGLPTEFRFDMQQDMQSGSGTGRISPEHAISLSDHGDSFLKLLMPEETALNLDQGTLGFEYQPTWHDGKPADHLLEVSLGNLSGRYADLLFSGLNLNGSLFCAPDNPDGSSLGIENIRYGVDIENLQAGLCVEMDPDGQPPRFHVRDIRTNFLGSSIRGTDFVYDARNPRNHLSLSVSDLDMNRLVELQQFQDLSVTGTLEGRLPVMIHPDGVSIAGGRLTSRQEGRLHYRLDPALGESAVNPAIWPALKALSDFRYELIDAGIDYQPDGELSVRLRIEGSNPEFENGRPIHLNINSQQNVLSLLKSLQYTDKRNVGQETGILPRNLVNDALEAGSSEIDAGN